MQKWKYNRILQAIDQLPAEERRAAKRGLLRLSRGRGNISASRAIGAIGDVITAAARGHGKRASNKETDRRRRVLVGARVPRERAAKYQEAAAVQGLSLYAWVVAALDRAAASENAQKQQAAPQEE